MHTNDALRAELSHRRRVIPPGEMDLVELLCAIAELAVDIGGPLELLQRAVTTVLSHTGWPIGSIWLIGPADTLIPVDPGRADLTGTFNATALQRDGRRGLPGRVTESGKPAWITDINADDEFPRRSAAFSAGLKSAFALPVSSGPNVVAVLEFFAPEVIPPDSRLLRAMRSIGIQLGRAFETGTALREAKAAAGHARQVLDAAHDAFIAMDSDGVVIEWNMQAESIFGWTSAEALGRIVSEFIIPDADRADHEAAMREILTTGRTAVSGRRIELEGLRRNGEVFPLEISFWALPADAGWNFYSLCRDITDRKAREADWARRALHDELTGLANRSLAIDHISRALARRSRHGLDVAVLFLDLDQFKVVNDSFGHHIGDHVLKAVAQRVTSAVRPDDTVARISGDEFAIICDELPSPADATRLSDRILSALSSPVDIAEDRIQIGASIGIALAGSAEATAESLLRDADAAMYWAKQHGRNQAAIFDEAMRGRLYNKLRTEQELTAATSRQKLRLHHQPVVDPIDGRTVGVEALARWHRRRPPAP